MKIIIATLLSIKVTVAFTADLFAKVEVTRPVDSGGSDMSHSEDHPINNGVFSLLYTPPDGIKHQLKIKKVSRVGQPGRLTEKFVFTLQDIPFCNYQLIRHRWKSGRLLRLGTQPPIAPSDLDHDLKWPHFEDALSHFKSLSENISIKSSRKCYVSVGNEPIPAWEFTYEQFGLIKTIQLDDSEVFTASEKCFHAEGSATIYPENIKTGELTSYKLYNMAETGYLENDHFFTTINSSSLSPRAQSLDFNFAFDPASSEFAETSIFTNANRALEWYEGIGYNKFTNTKMQLVVHAMLNNNSNNALYQPSSKTPTIYVGDGDGSILQNLATDRDVVFHEFGHHVIYHTLTRTTGESLVLHEGIADFFTFASSGDACLGESICPDKSNINCAIESKCLRTAENDLSLLSPTLPPEEHLRSQFISGMLWDLHVKDAIPLENVARLTLNAVGLLANSSGYHDLILALLYADIDLFSKQYCSTIYQRAIARGLSNEILDFDCTQEAGLPIIEGLETTVTTTATTEKKESNPFCGVTAQGRHNPLSVLIVLLPILFINLLKMET